MSDDPLVPAAPPLHTRRRATGNPYRTLHARMSPPGTAWDEGHAAGAAAERATIVKLLRAKGTHAADVLADQIEAASPTTDGRGSPS